MQYWNEMIHTAMLGTGKKVPDAQAFPVAICEAITQLPSSVDSEELFLQTAALAFNFRQSSVVPVIAQDASITQAEKEILPYCNPKSMAVLSDILNVDSTSLLHLWLQTCSNHQQIVQPDIIPQLLEIAVKQKGLRTLIANCCGNRGLWLSNFNPAWNFGSTATPEEIWQTGTLQQRVQVLVEMRADEPAKALEWLQQTWPQEDAATKTELLGIMENNISIANLSFLENLATEKSKKVKDLASNLIKLIPESTIVQAYWKVLQESVYLKKEKALLGLTSKTKLIVQLPETIDENIYKSGIDKLSKNAKEISDENYVLQQLASQVPPQWWEAHLGESKEAILQLLQKNNDTKFLIASLGKAAIHFKNVEWLQAIIKADNYNYLYLAGLPLLPINEQEEYAMQLLSQDGNTPHAVILTLLSYPTEWSVSLARKILPVMMNDPWTYNKTFFGQHIHLVPQAILPELNSWKPAAEWHQQYWNNATQAITQLLEIKQQIQPSFNA